MSLFKRHALALLACGMWSALLLLGGLAGLHVRAEEAPPGGAGAFKSAGIELDVKKHELRVDATVCLDAGILEYLVCLPDTLVDLIRTHSRQKSVHEARRDGILFATHLGEKPCPR